MGKGTIVSGGSDGLYTVDVQLDRANIEARIERLTQEQGEKLTELEAAEDEHDQLQDVLNALRSEQEALIEALPENPTGDDLEPLNAKSAEVVEAATRAGQALALVRSLRLQLLAISKELTRLASEPTSVSVSAWCADFTEDLSGDVGLIEVPGAERGQHLQIRPGYDGRAVYQSSRDGMLRRPLADVPAATFYNLAMLPGWQKWYPRYRLATLTSVSGDTCSLVLWPVSSGQQSIDLNHARAYTNVPIQYMDCDGFAFEVGDSVVVEFSSLSPSSPENNWDSAKLTVIGFKDNPNLCTVRLWWLTVDSEATRLKDASRFERPTLFVAGNKNWYGEKYILSWDGNDLRYNKSITSSKLYCNGSVIKDNGNGYKFIAAAYSEKFQKIFIYSKNIAAVYKTWMVYSIPATPVGATLAIDPESEWSLVARLKVNVGDSAPPDFLSMPVFSPDGEKIAMVYDEGTPKIIEFDLNDVAGAYPPSVVGTIKRTSSLDADLPKITSTVHYLRSSWYHRDVNKKLMTVPSTGNQVQRCEFHEENHSTTITTITPDEARNKILYCDYSADGDLLVGGFVGQHIQEGTAISTSDFTATQQWIDVDTVETTGTVSKSSQYWRAYDNWNDLVTISFYILPVDTDPTRDLSLVTVRGQTKDAEDVNTLVTYSQESALSDWNNWDCAVVNETKEADGAVLHGVDLRHGFVAATAQGHYYKRIGPTSESYDYTELWICLEGNTEIKFLTKSNESFGSLGCSWVNRPPGAPDGPCLTACQTSENVCPDHGSSRSSSTGSIGRTNVSQAWYGFEQPDQAHIGAFAAHPVPGNYMYYIPCDDADENIATAVKVNNVESNLEIIFPPDTVEGPFKLLPGLRSLTPGSR